MRGVARLAWRSLTHHRGRSVLLMACVALVAYLPMAVELLVQHYQVALTRRAVETPLVVGAPGSRFDLLVRALYFRGKLPAGVTYGQARAIQERGQAVVAPLVLGHTVQGRPIAGTTLDYFPARGLRLRVGRLPAILGEAVLGAEAARALGVEPGQSVLSDTEKLYDIGAAYPLRMPVVGVLEESGEADDGAVFVDLKTAWVIAGLGHGHQDISGATDPLLVLSRTPAEVTSSAAVVEYNQITPENLASFHFHGDLETYPVTAILVWPRDAKARTLLRAELAHAPAVLLLEPAVALAELLEVAVRVKRFFDANLALVSVAMALMLGLVVLLSLRVRARELETLFKIGCSRATVVAQQALELGLVIVGGLTAAGALALITVWAVVEGWVGL